MIHCAHHSLAQKISFQFVLLSILLITNFPARLRTMLSSADRFRLTKVITLNLYLWFKDELNAIEFSRFNSLLGSVEAIYPEIPTAFYQLLQVQYTS